MERVYLDHNATTPVGPEVLEAMRPYLTETYGNASSVHGFGREAKVALETAREQIAAAINCQPSELYFTSGGTESNNLAVIGATRALRKRRNHVVVGAAEHHAVLEPAEYLAEKEGTELNLAPVSRDGLTAAGDLERVVTDRTALVSIMHANNETGVIQDIATLAETARRQGALFHTDAVQSVGKIEVDVRSLGVDMLSLTAHKLYGPKGIGALFVRAGVKISPLLHGGSHERRRRPGTENVAGAVGLAKALEIAGGRIEQDSATARELSEFFIGQISKRVPDIHFAGLDAPRIPQTINVAFDGIEGESIVLGLDLKGVAVSSGSACTSGATEPSHVLTAMGIPSVTAQGAIRISMGRSTTRDKLEYVLGVLPPIVERLRAMSPIYSGSTQDA